MGSDKAVLTDPRGVPFVVRVARTLEAAGLRRIVIVGGGASERIAAAVHQTDWTARVDVATNPQPDRGQLSSLLIGMAAASDDPADGVRVTLVDVPLVTAGTVRAVVDAWQARRAPIVRPASGGRHGHPVIFDRRLFGELAAAPLHEGAKHVVRAHEAEIENVPVDDPGSFEDIDTPEDYLRVRGPY